MHRPPLQNQVGPNHMAWMMDSLDDLKELYQRLKDKNVEIDRVSDHGISIAVYLKDPDVNGIEVSCKLPSSPGPREEKLFLDGGTEKGRFPGLWDELLARQAAVSA